MKHKSARLLCALFALLFLASCQAGTIPSPSGSDTPSGEPKTRLNRGLLPFAAGAGDTVTIEGVDVTYTLEDDGIAHIAPTESELTQILSAASGDHATIDLTGVEAAGMTVEFAPTAFQSADKGLRLILPAKETAFLTAASLKEIGDAAEDGESLRFLFREGPVIAVLQGDGELAHYSYKNPLYLSVPYSPASETENADYAVLVRVPDDAPKSRMDVMPFEEGEPSESPSDSPSPSPSEEPELPEGAKGTPVPRSFRIGDTVCGVVYGPGRYAASYRAKTAFSDVTTDWMKTPIMFLAARDVANGTSATTYRPNDPVTRAEFVALLVRSLDVDVAIPDPTVPPSESPSPSPTEEPTASPSVSPTTDPLPTIVPTEPPDEMRTGGRAATGGKHFVDEDTIPSWFLDSVLKAKALGIVEGSPSGNFNPNNKITRQDIFVMCHRALLKFDMLPVTPAETSRGSTPPAFIDWGMTAGYAKAPITELFKAGLINGVGGNKLNPTGFATRYQGSQFLYNILKMDAEHFPRATAPAD